MTASSLSCPYCNALVPAAADGAGTALCPRCGERLPGRGPSANGAVPAPYPPLAADANLGPVERVAERLRGWSKRQTALLVLGVMATMATAGLVLALLTTKYRRSNDFPSGQDEGASRVRAVAPAELSGLGYLPSDSDIVIGLHVAQALQDPAGRAFLARFRPGDLWHGQGGQAGPETGGLEEWLGLSLDDVDHIVAGLNAEGRVIPRLVLVVQTRRRYDPEKVRSALKASRSPEPGRPLFRFQLNKPPLEAVLWFASERTLIVGLSPEDLRDLPDTPRLGPDHLAAPLQGMLKEKIWPTAQAWVAGHAEDWDRTGARLPLSSLSKEGRKALEGVRTFGMWLQFGGGVGLGGSFQCRDAAAAEALERYLVPPEERRKPIPLLGGGPEGEAAARELARTLTSARKDNEVTVQAKASAEAVERGAGQKGE